MMENELIDSKRSIIPRIDKKGGQLAAFVIS
jgi:hypothetical protein